jgi:hypothetical protein
MSGMTLRMSPSGGFMTSSPVLAFHIRRGDGWIRGSHQQLLFWVIPEWHGSVQWHPYILIIGQSRVRFDLCSWNGMDKMYL